MRLERAYNKKREIFDNYLNIISDIKFTLREIDVIVCILHNRGEKKIALLLSISPRTVSTHIHNIMLKLGINSKEHLIDFIEKSGKLLFIRQYYLDLLIQNSFENKLIKIAKTINKHTINCFIDYTKISIEEKNILDQIKKDMNLANVILRDLDEINKEITNNFCLLSTYDLVNNKQNKNKSIILIFNEINNPMKNTDNEYLDFSKKEEYYFTIFALLGKIIKKNSLLEEIIQEFIREYEVIDTSCCKEKKQEDKNLITYLLERKINKKNLILLICFLLIASGIITYKFLIQNNLVKISIDKPLINKQMLLNRKSMLDKVEKRLLNPNDIKTVVLVGVGGSGKTTLARQYVRNQKTQLMWEINCETSDNIILSFLNLAHSLCATEEDNQRLKIILQNTNQNERQKNLFIFLTSKIKNYPNWILLYDNVEEFKDIQQYFPYNKDVWGNGTVIITTRDSNIANNSYILSENIIKMEELNEEEKLELFKKIISNDTNIDDLKITFTDFVKKIPPFPLDISIAAHCIKEMRISYDQYLQYITQSQEAFISNQKALLNDIGEYNKTRHEIIVFSLKYIIEINPDFADLLLFVSLIDSENISKEILVKYKDEMIVNKFFHKLKRFSLIHEKLSNNNGEALTFFMHRNTQLTSLSYLIKEFQLTKNSKQFEDIANSLLYYPINVLNKPENMSIASQVVPHIQMFLSHGNLFNEKIFNNLSEELGIYYGKIANYQKARILLERVLSVNKKYYGDKDIKTATVAAHLGVLYKNIGDDQQGIVLLENALKIYQRFYGKNHVKSINCATYLANLYKNIGAYRKAQELLEYILVIPRKESSLEDINLARSKAYLGDLYNDIGEYSKAKNLLEESLKVYNHEYGYDSPLTVGSLLRLSNLYINIGEYTKAKKLSEKALIIYNKNYGENHIDTALSLLSLGNALLSLGVYKEGLKSLEQALSIYKRNYDQDNIKIALVLNNLGVAYLLMKNLATAETFFNQALNILKKNKHPNSFISLEKLSELYTKRSIEENNKGNIEEMHNLKKQAIIYLEQALEEVQACMPENSHHITRIKLKIQISH